MFFRPFSSHIDPSFWITLADKKLHEYKLCTDPVDICAFFTTQLGSSLSSCVPYTTPVMTGMNQVGQSRAKGPRIEDECVVHVSDASFAIQENMRAPRRHVSMRGKLIVTNTFEEFKGMNRVGMVADAINEIVKNVENRVLNEQTADELSRFLLVVFADLKAMVFTYWFCFPSVTFQIDNVLKLSRVEEESSLKSVLHDYFGLQQPGVFGVLFLESVPQIVSFKVLLDLISANKLQKYYFGFVDPSGSSKLGWNAQNLIYFTLKYLQIDSISILCFRDMHSPLETEWKSVIFDIKVNMSSIDTKGVGWELNSKLQMGPRKMAMKDFMDPDALISSSLNLNLSLLKWRLLPSLNLDHYSTRKVLLIGMGTLGCAVARVLLAWGFKNFSLMDNGVVSWSNPVRQSLYTPKQVLMKKVDAAADSIRELLPSAIVKSIFANIPMPGHPEQNLLREFEILQQAIHDVDLVFVLTDSRESRWLPSLLCSVASKFCIHVALAWDGFLILRQGVNDQIPKLGCYFCSDVMAPSDSLSNRTLDQQCTVTRPGLAAHASSLAVEMMASVLQYGIQEKVGTNGRSCLGSCPHTLRGSLSNFETLSLSFHAFDKCTCCSVPIREKFLKDGIHFISKGIADPNYLEEVAGLTRLKVGMDELDVDWDEEEDT